ncbi:MAG: VOC family protein [Archangium sp.]
MIVSLHHAQITVPRGAEMAARKFYCEQLGLREIAKPEVLLKRGGFWLELGAVQIHVGTEDGVERKKTKAHLGFEVDDLSEMRTLVDRLGLEVSEGEPLPGLKRFEFRDPFGNRVEFVQRSAS